MFVAKNPILQSHSLAQESCAAAGTFILAESQDTWHANTDIAHSVSINSCCFSINHYTEDLFGKHGIFFPPEMEKAVIKRRAEFFAGRYCAKQSLISLTGKASTIHIGPGRNPLWPAPITGAISHSNTHAIAVTALKSHVRGIGIDLQEEIDFDTYSSIKTQILFGDELELVRHDNPSLQMQVFSLIFSVKESFFKAAFPEVGRYFDFSCVSVVSIDQREQCIHLKINETLSRGLTEGLMVKAHYQYLAGEKLLTLVILRP